MLLQSGSFYLWYIDGMSLLSNTLNFGVAPADLDIPASNFWRYVAKHHRNIVLRCSFLDPLFVFSPMRGPQICQCVHYSHRCYDGYILRQRQRQRWTLSVWKHRQPERDLEYSMRWVGSGRFSSEIDYELLIIEILETLRLKYGWNQLQILIGSLLDLHLTASSFQLRSLLSFVLSH